jgi:hypothetical protein
MEQDTFIELSAVECGNVVGGRIKLPFQRVSVGSLLTTPDGDPVTVYVDGIRVNSVSDGFVHL